MVDAFFLVLCGSCCRRWVSTNAASFLRLCLILHPDPVSRWVLGACHSHTPHCCPLPWREIRVTGVKGAALFLNWVWSQTHQQPKVPRKSQIHLLCSPCEKTGFRRPHLRCRFLKVESERSQKPHPAIYHVLQHPDLHCGLNDLGCAMWPWQCDPTLGLLVVGQQSPACATRATAPPTLPLAALGS